MRIPSLETSHNCVSSSATGSAGLASGTATASSNSLLCKLFPANFRYDMTSATATADGKPVQVVFSAQSRDAVIYVTVVLVIYIVIFVVLVVTSYRKSSALRDTLNRHLRFQYSTGPFGTPTILETDSRGGQVHCDTVDELHEGSIQL